MSDNHKRKRSTENDDEKDEEICTLHISGLPMAILPRELKNLCRFLPEFTDCSLVHKQRPMGFARFESRTAAERAMEMINGVQFDDEDPDSIIRANLAKRNMVIRQRRPASARRSEHKSYPDFMHHNAPNPYAPWDAPYFPPSTMNPYAFNMDRRYESYGGSRDRSYDRYSSGGYGSQGRGGGGGGGVIECRESGRPLDTLCVRGLGGQTAKADIQDVFSRVPGYSFMSFLRSRSLCFVRFQDNHAASSALRTLQGQVIPNCDGAVTVEFARRSLTEDRPEDRS